MASAQQHEIDIVLTPRGGRETAAAVESVNAGFVQVGASAADVAAAGERVDDALKPRVLATYAAAEERVSAAAREMEDELRRLVPAAVAAREAVARSAPRPDALNAYAAAVGRVEDQLHTLPPAAVQAAQSVSMLKPPVDAVEQALDTLARSTRAPADGLEDVAEAAADMRRPLTDAAAALDSVNDELDEFGESASHVAQAAGAVDSSLKARVLDAYGDAARQVSVAAREMGDDMRRLSPAAAAAQESVARVAPTGDALAEYGAALGRVEEELQTLPPVAGQAAEGMSVLESPLAAAGQTLDAFAASARPAAGGLDEITKAAKDTRPSLDGAAAAVGVVSAGLVELDGSAAKVAVAGKQLDGALKSQALDGYASSAVDGSAALREMEGQIRRLSPAAAAANEAVARAPKVDGFDAYGASVGRLEGQLQALPAAADQAAEGVSTLKSPLAGTGQSLDSLAASARPAAGGMDEIAKAAKDTRPSLDETAAALGVVTVGVVEFGTSAAQAAAAGTQVGDTLKPQALDAYAVAARDVSASARDMAADVREISPAAVAAHEAVARVAPESNALDDYGAAVGRVEDQLQTLVPKVARAAENVWLLEPPLTAAGDGLDEVGRSTRPAADGLDDVEDSAGGARKKLENVVPPEVKEQLKELKEGLEGLNAELDAGGRIESFGNNLTSKVSLPITAAAGASTMLAVSFDDSMTKLETLVGIGHAQIEAWRTDLTALGPVVGRMPKELADGMFVITSAGQRGAEALETLGYSAKAATVGLGETGQIARVATAASAAYAAQNLSSKRSIEILLATAREGNFEVSQLGDSLGSVLPVASQVGASFEDVGAFVATMTRLNGDAAQSITGLRGFLQSIIAPGDEAQKVLAKIGLSAEDLRKSVRERGLTETLIYLTTLLKGNDEALATIVPTIEGLIGVMGTAGLQSADYRKVAENVAQSTGILDDAFAIVEQRDGHKMRAAAIEVANLGVAFGAELAPALVSMLQAAEPVVDVVSGMITVFSKLPSGVQMVVIGFGGIVVAAGPVISTVGMVVQTLSQLKIAATTAQTVTALGGLPAVMNGAAAAATATGGAAEFAAGGITTLTVTVKGLALTLGVGSIVLVSLGLLAAAFSNAGDEAREMGENAEEAAAKAARALSQMATDALVAERAAVVAGIRAKDAEAERVRSSIPSLSSQPTVVEQRTVGPVFGPVVPIRGPSPQDVAAQRVVTLQTQEIALRNRLAEIDAQIRDRELAATRAAEAARIQADAARRASQMGRINMDDDKDSKGRRQAPLQIGQPGTDFSDIQVQASVAFGQLSGDFAQLTSRAEDLQVEIATTGESLSRLPAGSQAFKDANEHVYKLRNELQQVNAELAVTLSGVQQLAARAGIEVNAAGAVTVLPVDLSGLQDVTAAGQRELSEWSGSRREGAASRRRQTQIDNDATLRGYAAEGERRVVAAARAGTGWTELPENTRQYAESKEAYNEMVRAYTEGAHRMDAAKEAAVSAIGEMATAWITGSEDIEQAVIASLTSIAQVLPGVGPLGAAVIGTIGGIVGGLFGGRERDREEEKVQRVKVEEYGDRAVSQQRELKEGPDRVTIQIIDSRSGAVVDQYELGRRERRDAVSRFPATTYNTGSVR